MTTDPQTMGALLKSARESRNMSREDVATAIDSDPSTIWRIEAGQRKPNYQLMEAILLALRCQLRLGCKGPVIFTVEALA